MTTEKDNKQHYMSSVKLGPKGQIVIPKEVREMFGLNFGDTIVLLADKERGIALQSVDKLEPVLKEIFYSTQGKEKTE